MEIARGHALTSMLSTNVLGAKHVFAWHVSRSKDEYGHHTTVLRTKFDEQKLEKEQLTNLMAVGQTRHDQRVALLNVFHLVMRRRRCETFLSFF